MNKEVLKICYVDDNIDPYLMSYIDFYTNLYNEKNSKLVIEAYEYEIKEDDTYKSLLNQNLITESNILLLDSEFFSSASKSNSSLTGEQFLIILRKILPFIKTIVITQNEIEHPALTVEKFKSALSDNAEIDSITYYNEKLKKFLDQSLSEHIEEKKILKELKRNNETDELLYDTIEMSLDGLEDDTIFEKEELNELIILFKQIKEGFPNA